MTFLPSETINNPNAVEEIFCKEMDNAKTETLNKEDFELFVTLCSSKPKPLESVNKEDKFFLYEVIEKRVQHCFGYKITDARTIILIATMSKTTGGAIMLLTYIQYRCKKDNIKEVTFDYLIKLFPDGFVTESELETIWSKQKVSKSKDMSSDNLLDYQSALKSIQF